MFNLKINPRFHQKNGVVSGTGYEMEVSGTSILDFYSVIGECPVASMAYKWKDGNHYKLVDLVHSSPK